MPVIEGNPEHIADKEFRPKIARCLKLLQTKSPTGNALVSKVEKIRAARASGANFADKAIDIARLTFDASDTWVASVLAHEAQHFKQKADGKYKAGEEAEKDANLVQLGVLECIGAPKSEITYLKTQNGKHFDLNGDGVYDEKDYNLRKY
jgi:hypothetical protein